VSGRQSTAAETHEHNVVILYNARPATFVAVSGFRFRLRRGVGQFRAGLTERLVSPKEAVRAGSAKRCRGNKRTLDALLLRCEFVKHCMESSAKVGEKVEPASSLVSPIRLVREGQSKHGSRNARTRRSNKDIRKNRYIHRYIDT
jgi:hypothetical protein